MARRQSSFYLDLAKKSSQTFKVDIISLKVISLITNFISVPFLILFSGSNTYGKFVVIISITAILSSVDFGFSNAAIRAISTAGKKGYKQSQGQIISGVLVLSGIVSVSLTFIGVVLAYASSSNELDKVNLLSVFQNGKILFIVFFTWALHLVGSSVQRIFLGLGLDKIANTWNLVPAILGNVTAIIGSKSSEPLLGMLLGLHIIPKLLSLLSIFHLIKKLQVEKVNLKRPNIEIIVELLTKGRLFIFLQLTSVVSANLNPIIIFITLGSQSVTLYHSIWKAVSIPVGITVFIYQPLWAEVSKISTEGKSIEIIESLRKALKSSLIIVISLQFFVIVFGQKLLDLWLPLNLESSSLLIYLLALGASIQIMMQPISFTLNGLHATKIQYTFTSVAILFNVCLSYILGINFGLEGLVLGGIISTLLFLFLPYTSLLFSTTKLSLYMAKLNE